MSTILDNIIEGKKAEIASLYSEKGLSYFQQHVPITQSYHPGVFYNALKHPGLSLIAEIKKASPSKGIIRTEFDPIALAEEFNTSGASALSVLTEVSYFKGDPSYIQKIKKTVKLPILRKDFIIDPIQILESKKLGADAILLIKAILNIDTLRELQHLAHCVGLDVLVEVHNKAELDEIAPLGCPIIGINNRNLATFEVDIKTTIQLAKTLQFRQPKALLVAESGYTNAQQLNELPAVGVNAVLIGEGLATHPELLPYFATNKSTPLTKP
jgi:indole-3-glycerol phosphate synthase